MKGLRKIQELRQKELHDEDLCNFFSSQDLIIVSKSRMMKCVGYVVSKRALRNGYGFPIGISKAK